MKKIIELETPFIWSFIAKEWWFDRHHSKNVIYWSRKVTQKFKKALKSAQNKMAKDVLTIEKFLAEHNTETKKV